MFRDEMRRVLTRTRNQVMALLLIFIPILLGIVIKLTRGPRAGNGPALFAEITHNALFLPLASLASMETILLPLIVSVVGGDSIAGDAANGSLRYLLVRGLSRRTLVNSKLFAALIYTLIGCILITVSGLITGFLLFPTKDLITLSGQPVSLAAGIFDLGVATATVAISMLTVACLAVLFSSYTSSPLGATTATVLAVVLVQVLDTIPQLSWLHPILFSNYWGAFIGAFRSPIDLAAMVKNLVEQLVWIAGSYLFAQINFAQKDILD
jgi:ABC-2 type transport system permease protein